MTEPCRQAHTQSRTRQMTDLTLIHRLSLKAEIAEVAVVVVIVVDDVVIV